MVSEYLPVKTKKSKNIGDRDFFTIQNNVTPKHPKHVEYESWSACFLNIVEYGIQNLQDSPPPPYYLSHTLVTSELMFQYTLVPMSSETTVHWIFGLFGPFGLLLLEQFSKHSDLTQLYNLRCSLQLCYGPSCNIFISCGGILSRVISF